MVQIKLSVLFILAVAAITPGPVVAPSPYHPSLSLGRQPPKLPLMNPSKPASEGSGPGAHQSAPVTGEIDVQTSLPPPYVESVPPVAPAQVAQHVEGPGSRALRTLINLHPPHPQQHDYY